MLQKSLSQAARLCELHVAEQLLGGVLSRVGGKTKFNETFIYFEAIFHEGDLKFLAVKTASQCFQSSPRFLVGIVGQAGIARGLLNLAHQEFSLVSKHGSLERGEAFQCVPAMSPSGF